MGAPPETLVRDTPHGSERRRVSDRRARPTTLLGALRPGGRRRGFRRSGEGRNRYIDRIDAVTVFLSLLILFASILDAILTLRHLNNGGWELNPLMHAVLQRGVPFFVSVKILSTGIGVVFLAIHQNFALGRLTLRLAALIYVALLGYHAFLLVA